MSENKSVLITGGAGYIGSCLVGSLLAQGKNVTVLDALWFGGESLLPFLSFPNFRLIVGDVGNETALSESMKGIDCVVHLAALVGFPACDKAGKETTRRINVDCTRQVYFAAHLAGVERMIFASSYSNYGRSLDGQLVTEESPLFPQSSYAETKIEAEKFLLNSPAQDNPVPICLRLATVFGLSPRTRFDLILNQFVLEAQSKGKLEIYQENFKRSFVHVQDVVRAMGSMMEAPIGLVGNQVYNVGSENLNASKQDLVKLISGYLPGLKINYRDASFTSDMQSIDLSFEKIRKAINYEVQIDLEQGIKELLWALNNGVIQDPFNEKYRNHPPILD
jgi:nucleoside-diphosphate-sugar epimerase